MRTWIAALACLLLGIAGARASVADAPGSALRVALITYGPGATYWERFGHDALELTDTASGESIDFNYGVFDFDAKGFLLNFARGRMRYLMDAEYAAPEQASYAQDGRSVTRQRLALSPAQASALRDFLLWNLQPANAAYNYDYYTDNCTTRVRDALDRVLGGAIRRTLQEQPGGMTYRQQTARLMRAQPWLMLALDLGLGPYADQPLDGWRESFLPMVLQARLRDVRIGSGTDARPLVADETLLAPNRLQAPPATAPDLRPPLAIAGLALALILLALRRGWRTGFALLGTLYLIAAGSVGVLLLVLWTLTAHRSAWANANLLAFNPLAFALIGALWRTARGRAARAFAQGLIAAQLLALLAAVGLHLLPGVVQQNQPWLLFAWPAWLAIAWSLRQTTPPHSSQVVRP